MGHLGQPLLRGQQLQRLLLVLQGLPFRPGRLRLVRVRGVLDANRSASLGFDSCPKPTPRTLEVRNYYGAGTMFHLIYISDSGDRGLLGCGVCMALASRCICISLRLLATIAVFVLSSRAGTNK